MLNVRRNVIFSIVELVTNLVLVFISYRIVVRVGGVSLLGVWSTLFAWMSLIRLGDIGVGGAVTRYVAGLDAKEEQIRVRQFVHTGVISNIAIYAVLVFIAWILMSRNISWMVGSVYRQTAINALPWMVASLFANNAANIVLSSLLALHVGYQRSILTVLGNLIQLAMVAALVPSHGLEGLAQAQFLQFTLMTVGGWLLVCRMLGRIEMPRRFSWAVLSQMLSFSVKLQLATAINGLFEPLSKILVGHFGGMVLQGFYEAAFKTVFLSRNVAVQASSATVPAMTRLVWSDPDRARALYRQVYRNILRALVGILMVVVLASPVISVWWFGSVKEVYVIFVATLAAGIAASGWCTPAYNLGLATGRLWGNIVAMGASLVSLAVIGSVLGLAGLPQLIVVAVAASMILSSVLIVFQNERLIGISRPWSRFKTA